MYKEVKSDVMRRSRKQYKRPKKPWDKNRIKNEWILIKEYGLKNKHELWRAQSILRKFRRMARELIAVSEKKRVQVLMNKLVKLGILGKDSTLDDVLSLTIRDILDRRLQTVVFKRGLSKSVKQARQLIVHGHICIDGIRIKSPSMLVPKDLEEKLEYSNPDIERVIKNE